MAVIHHIGESPSRGHYIATFLNPGTNQMWKYDGSVTPVWRLGEKSAYVLFYKKDIS